MGSIEAYTTEILARRAAQVERPRVSLRAEAKNLFGFGDAEIKLTEYMTLFQRFQNEMGISKNFAAIYENWIHYKLPRQMRAPIIRDSVMFDFTNVQVKMPSSALSNDKVFFPQEFMERGETYAANIVATINVKGLNSAQGLLKTFVDQTIGRVPVMKGSAMCSLYKLSDDHKAAVGECFNDPQGYFIIKGNEKTIISQEKLDKSQIHVAKFVEKQGFEARMTCVSDNDSTIVRMNIITHGKTGFIVRMSYFEQGLQGSIGESVNVLLLFVVIFYLKNIDEAGNYTLRDYPCLEGVDYIIRSFILPSIYKYTSDEESRYIKHQLNLTIARARGKASSYGTLGELFEYFRTLKRVPFKVGPGRKAVAPVVDPLRDIQTYLFGHIPPTADRSDLDERWELLAMMTCMLSRVNAGFRHQDDRDSWANKRIETAGVEMERTFNKAWSGIVATWPEAGTSTSSIIFPDKPITEEFIGLFNKSGFGNVARARRAGDMLKRETPLAINSQIQRLTTRAPVKSAHTSIRQIHPTQMGFICIGETPEGVNCGLLKNLGATCWISLERDGEMIRNAILSFMTGHTSPVKSSDHQAPLLLDGRIMFWCNSDVALKLLRPLKRHPSSFDISIAYSEVDKCVFVYSDGARPCRPLLVVDEETRLLKYDSLSEADRRERTILELTQMGVIEFVHSKEQESSWTMSEDPRNELPRLRTKNRAIVKIAKYPRDVASFATEQETARKFVSDHSGIIPDDLQDEYNRQYRIASLQMYTHSEIEPQAQFGLSGCTIPGANHNQGPRITYQCSMGKQAHSGYHSLQYLRTDTSYKRLLAPSRTLFETDMYEPIGLNAMPATETPIVALMGKEHNNEDALVIKEEFLTNNMLYMKHTTHRQMLDQNSVVKYDATVLNRKKPARYHAIIKEGRYAGYPRPGSFLKEGDCLFMRFISSVHEPRHVMIGVGEEGYVERVIISINALKSRPVVRIKVAQIRRQVVGDKLAIRISQKGTAGEVRPAKDLPRIRSGPNKGVVPDFFFNPHSLISRMTQIVMKEGLCSKAAVYSGKRIDATTFYVTAEQIIEAQATLRAHGLDEGGMEEMELSNGNPIPNPIFVAPISYQSLRHNVLDKIQMRDHGEKVPLTRQPTRGRSNRGGIKYGEMERDSTVSHGASEVLLDRYMNSSDKYPAVYCTVCGRMAISDFTLEGTLCTTCGDRAKFGFVKVPYIFILFTRLVACMNVEVRLKLKIFSEIGM